LPDRKGWTAFRDLKNGGPLKKYFQNDVEMAIIRFFSGKVPLLKKAVQHLKGKKPEIDLNYDVAAQLTLLPLLPVILTFNDEDEDFPAACSVLFDGHAESFLDAESLAIAARVLAVTLKAMAV
jgi:hypothetical protein